ncbi:MAG: alpha-L-fucosidase [Rikenellaceae bacterium]
MITKTKISLALVAMALSCMAATAQIENLPMTEGKFAPSDESLKQYEYPEWFADAKFGIWSHWGPQSATTQGNWSARTMYLQDNVNRKTGKSTGKPHPAYTSHVKLFGHPSEVGFKDIAQGWKAERFNPDELMKLYKRVGAKYFVSMGVHHDNFSLWATKLNRWNSVNMGPKRDIVGDWQQAARREGLKFGVSEHLGASYTWFQTARGADKTGPKAGVPYDGANPEYEDFYHAKAADDDTGWYTNNPIWQRDWYDRIKELVDMYQPDLLYTDGSVVFDNEVGRTLIAHYYNQDLEHNKRNTVVYACKEDADGRFVRDLERGIIEDIAEDPWQTDTSIGNWFYKEGQGYASSVELLQMLVDIVSKNGNLLLNVVQTPEGDLEADVVKTLEEMATWMEINGEAIYGTRPWVIFGQGPSLSKDQGKGYAEGIKDIRSYEAGDLRFTTKGKKLYIFAMEPPREDLVIEAMPKTSRVKSVRVLGGESKLSFEQGASGKFTLKLPSQMPDERIVVFEVTLK